MTSIKKKEINEKKYTIVLPSPATGLHSPSHPVSFPQSLNFWLQYRGMWAAADVVTPVAKQPQSYMHEHKNICTACGSP